MKKIAFYGSLKRGQYNHDRFGKGSQVFIKEAVIPNFVMYATTHYPAVVKSIVDSGQSRIHAEIHEVDEPTYQRIRGMERGAGYLETTVEIDGEQVILYIVDNGWLDAHGAKLVVGGNWTKEYYIGRGRP